MSRLTADDRWWLAILRSALGGDALPEPENAPDWGRILRAASRHNLLPMTAAGIEHYAGFVPEKARQTLEKARHQALFVEATRDLELEQLFNALSEEKIEFLPLKGTVLKRFYPSPELRTMGDVDLMIWPKDHARTEKILTASGWSLESRGVYNDKYTSRSIPLLELHHALVDRWGVFPSETMKKYFSPECLFERLVRTPGSFMLQMSPNDFFIYHFLHLIRHIFAGGIGVRFILDHYILTTELLDDSARAEAAKIIQAEGYERFFTLLNALSLFWFGKSTDCPREAEKLGEATFLGEIFGERQNVVPGRIRHFLKDRDTLPRRLIYIFRRAFPQYEKTVCYYPSLKKCPALLPLYWVRLNFDRLFTKNRAVFLPLLKSLLFVRREKTDLLGDYYRSLGLEPFIDAAKESDPIHDEFCDKNNARLTHDILKNNDGKYQRILIVKLSSLGDVLHTLPFVAAQRRLFPNAQIDWAVHPAFAALIPGLPWIDRVIPFRRPTLRHPIKTVRELFRLRKELHARQYDLSIDLQGLAKSALVVLLSGAKKRIGTAIMREGSALVSRRVVGEHRFGHAVERSLDVARFLGAVLERPEYPFADLKEANETVFSKIREKLVENDSDAPYVVFVPGTRWETKTWPAEYYALLSEYFIREGINVVLAGSSDDLALEQEIFHYLEHSDALAQETPLETTGQVVSMIGETSLTELAALIQNARLFVGGDTGPLHIAAAAGTRLITIFGPTCPERTGPYGSENASILMADLKCIGCLKRHCEHKNCMKAITPEMVWHAYCGEDSQRISDKNIVLPNDK